MRENIERILLKAPSTPCIKPDDDTHRCGVLLLAIQIHIPVDNHAELYFLCLVSVPATRRKTEALNTFRACWKTQIVQVYIFVYTEHVVALANSIDDNIKLMVNSD
jgi:hypothetical protein